MSREPSLRVSMLILAKCSCEMVEDVYEKILTNPDMKMLHRGEKGRAAELHENLAASHRRLGLLLERAAEEGCLRMQRTKRGKSR